ncbi:MAG TPA: MgtC/SapB family protein [Candidatus Binatia bacterium]|nr:MgtC/SapB family protein [Candidatus Binatia bacterium]
MPDIYTLAYKFAAALGIGLLIGAERERRKGEGPSRSPAGVRTFTIVSLAGAVSWVVGGVPMLGVTFVGVAALCAIGYVRTGDEDPGFTTETALLLTVLLGGFALKDPVTASALAVTVAIALMARTGIHHFIREVLSADELTDALIFAAAALVVLPLVPDRYVGPFSGINPRTVWKIVILIMSIGAAGHIAVRSLGARFGLPVAGFASGFVSSAATTASMGEQARKNPQISRPAVAGAVLSTVASLIQLGVVLVATNWQTFSILRMSMVGAGVMAVIYGGLLTLRSLREPAPGSMQVGRAFSLKTTLGFAAMIAFVQLLAAALNARYGSAGAIVGAALAGFADSHAPAVSIASLAASGKLDAHASIIAILAGLTTNTFTKMVLAIMSGGRRFALQIIPGLILVILGAWAGAILPLME